MSTYILLTAFAALVLFSLGATVAFAKYFNLWVQARMTGTNVGLFEMMGMSFRKADPRVVVRSKIMARQAGLSEEDGVTTKSLETHYLAGGDVPNVVRALIAAKDAELPFTFEHAAEIDLAGRDVLEVVRTSADAEADPS